MDVPGGSYPEVVVDVIQVIAGIGWHLTGFVRPQVEGLRIVGHWPIRVLPDVPTWLVAEPASHVDVPDAPFMQKLDRCPGILAGPILEPDLHQYVIGASRMDHLATLPQLVAGRLFHVDVLPSLRRPDSSERVPVVRGRETDSVDLRILKDAPHVVFGLRLVVVLLAHFTNPVGEEVLVDVTERLDVDVLQTCKLADEASSPTPDAHHSNVNLVVCPPHVLGDDKGESTGYRCTGTRPLEKISTGELVLTFHVTALHIAILVVFTHNRTSKFACMK